MIDRRILNIIIAIVLGISAVVLYTFFQKQPSGSKEGPPPELVRVIVARTNIARGTIIKASHLAYKKLPKEAVEPNAYLSPSQVIGKKASVDMVAGEQITSSKLTSKQQGRTLSMKTPVGLRAITIPIDRFSSFEGLINPGNFVDVIGIFKIPQKVGDRVITQNVIVPLFQNVRVLAVGPNIFEGGKSQKADTVTLALLPEQAELLAFAIEEGQIRLIMRSPLDSEMKPLPPMSMDTLWQLIFQSMGKEPAPQKEEQPQPAKIEIYRGGK